MKNRKRSQHMGVKHWKPGPLWDGLDVFVLGGGTSLDNFDVQCLSDELVIGCNDAYSHGPIIVDMDVFGDFKWYNMHHDKLKEYVKQGGVAVSGEPKVNTLTNNNAWLKKMPRQSQGLSRTSLGWNCNTGALALNLALILGAKTVYLLGFDMQLSADGRSNWHKNLLDKPKQSIYERMMRNFEIVKKQLPSMFPGCEVYNVNDYTRLNVFPILAFDEFWTERKNNVRNIEKVKRAG